MNIAILTSSHSTYDSRVFHKQARSLADAGHNVILVTPHDSDTERDGIQIQAVKGGDVESAGLGHAYKIYREAKSIDADVYHFHDPGLLPFGLLLSYTTDAKIIYDCHEQYEKAFRRYDFPPDCLNPLVGLFPKLQSLTANELDAVVTTTEEAAEDFRRRGHPNVVTVRNFPTTNDISFGDAPIEQQAEHLLVYVGGLDETRGLDEMLRLVSSLLKRDIDVEAWFIGSTAGKEDKTIERAAELGITDDVMFIGRVPHSEVFSYLHEGDVGLALLDPDRFEQDIPLKLFEYMYSEIPVLTTPIGASSEFIDDEWGIVVPFNNTEEQADEVAKLLTDPERRTEMGQRGKEKVENEYSWKNEKQKLLALYESLNK